MLQSYLNMLRIVQMTADETSRIEFKIKVKAVDDPDVVQKVGINLENFHDLRFQKLDESE